jgi:hypothetical protein
MSQWMELVRLGNYGIGVAKGQYTGVSAFHSFGFNRSIGTSYETIWNNGGGIYTFPSEELTMSVVSSSASDTMGVQITGLDDNYDIITEVVTLDGTTPVTTTQGFFRINDARITTGNNVGNITISNGGTTYSYIEATYGAEQSTVFTVPRDYNLWLNQVSFTSGTLTSNKYMFARACSTFAGGPQLHFFETTFVTSQLSYDLSIPFHIPEKTDFTLEAKSSAQENELSVYINGILARN